MIETHKFTPKKEEQENSVIEYNFFFYHILTSISNVPELLPNIASNIALFITGHFNGHKKKHLSKL